MSGSASGNARLLEPRNFASFLLVSLIWGGTWLVIRDQLSTVPAQWSITYRFAVASAGMFTLVAIRGEPIGLSCLSSAPDSGQVSAPDSAPDSGQVSGQVSEATSTSAWGWVLLLALLQFVLNFAFVYNAERFITSGLVAVMFALLMVPNAILGKYFLNQPISRAFVLGTIIAGCGVAMLFAHEYRASAATLGDVLTGSVLCAGGILAASGANIMQAMDGAKKLPFLTLLAWAMLAGLVINIVLAYLISGPPVFDARPAYALGILFLGLLGSVCTFPLYYRLVREVGAGTAAYSSLLVPVVAMILSTVFEGFRWGWLPAAGAALAMAGLVVALRGRAAPPPVRTMPEP